jgi:hypothetical protein
MIGTVTYSRKTFDGIRHAILDSLVGCGGWIAADVLRRRRFICLQSVADGIHRRLEKQRRQRDGHDTHLEFVGCRDLQRIGRLERLEVLERIAKHGSADCHDHLFTDLRWDGGHVRYRERNGCGGPGDDTRGDPAVRRQRR